MVARQLVILLRVDIDPADEREWWEALGLPEPVSWTLEETFGSTVYAEVEKEFALAALANQEEK